MTVPAEFGQIPLQRLTEGMCKRKRGILGEHLSIKTAVLVPLLFNARGELAILFEQRAATLHRQPSEISFPGGHCEPGDRCEKDTAIRETKEELGIASQDIHLLGPLDMVVARSSLFVYPFAGYLPNGMATLAPNPAEVDTVFTLSISTLLTATPEVYLMEVQSVPPENFPFELIPGGRNYPWRPGSYEEVFYRLEGHVVWGLTARILRHFLQVWQQYVPFPDKR
ncbi:CoA pyrophosphatase [Alicyclobacillaceae bacterium I2511]|nr:CoA pyrophosphatase [Alicyclobacillaceae bacterium I2511]